MPTDTSPKKRVYVDPETHRAIRIAAAEAGMTMEDYLHMLMTGAPPASTSNPPASSPQARNAPAGKTGKTG